MPRLRYSVVNLGNRRQQSGRRPEDQRPKRHNKVRRRSQPYGKVDQSDPVSREELAMKSLTDMAGNLDVSTAQVLTALRIVATRAGVMEVATWAAKEMEGYGPTDELPPHRSWKLSIVGDLHNPSQGVERDIHLGDLSIPDQYRAEVTTYPCRSGVGNLERMLANQQSDDGHWAVEHPNLAAFVNAGPLLDPGSECTRATAKFSILHLEEVVSRARQTALTLCLECEAKGVELQWAPDDASNAERGEWRNTLRQEGTKEAVKAAWDAAKILVLGS